MAKKQKISELIDEANELLHFYADWRAADIHDLMVGQKCAECGFDVEAMEQDLKLVLRAFELLRDFDVEAPQIAEPMPAAFGIGEPQKQ